MSDAVTLSNYLHDIVRLACRKCAQRGRYRRENLVDRFGGDMPMPEVLKQLADCERWGSFGDPCGAVFPDLARK